MTSVFRRRGGDIDRIGEDIEKKVMWRQRLELRGHKRRSDRNHQKVKRQGRDPPWSLHRSPVDILISSFWPPEL